MINARSETAAEKPMFRAAFRRRRCLIPGDGFYEWKRAGKSKEAFHIQLRDGAPLAFAGLWESWQPDESQPKIESCTVLTTEPNDLMCEIHDRMPVILPPAAYEQWLDPDREEVEELQALLHPFPTDAMVAEPVGSYVNNARHEGPQCLERQRSLFD